MSRLINRTASKTAEPRVGHMRFTGAPAAPRVAHAPGGDHRGYSGTPPAIALDGSDEWRRRRWQWVTECDRAPFFNTDTSHDR